MGAEFANIGLVEAFFCDVAEVVFVVEMNQPRKRILASLGRNGSNGCCSIFIGHKISKMIQKGPDPNCIIAHPIEKWLKLATDYKLVIAFIYCFMRIDLQKA